jgi:parvulin-like peptidyl-prolyl isomerase
MGNQFLLPKNCEAPRISAILRPGGYMLYYFAWITLLGTLPTSAWELMDQLEASVRSKAVLRSDLALFKQTLELRQQLDPILRYASKNQAPKDWSANDIREFLIEEALVLESFPVTSLQIQSEVERIQKLNRWTDAAFRQAISGLGGMTLEGFKSMVGIGISKAMLIQREIMPRSVITDEDVKQAFVQKHSKHGKDRVYHLQLIAITEDPKHKEQSRLKIDTIRSQIQRGERTFEEAAKSLSQHPSANREGDLGTLQEDMIAPYFLEAITKLEKGGISKVIQAQGQLFLVKLKDSALRDMDSYKDLKEQIRNELLDQAVQQQLRYWFTREKDRFPIKRVG